MSPNKVAPFSRSPELGCAWRLAAVALVVTACAVCSNPWLSPREWRWVAPFVERASAERFKQCNQELGAVVVGSSGMELWLRVIASRGYFGRRGGFGKPPPAAPPRHLTIGLRCSVVEEFNWRYTGINLQGEVSSQGGSIENYTFTVDLSGRVTRVEKDSMGFVID
jgi:RNase P/RNase MRP subunit p29